MAPWRGIRVEELFDAEHVLTWGGIGLILVIVAAFLVTIASTGLSGRSNLAARAGCRW